MASTHALLVFRLLLCFNSCILLTKSLIDESVIGQYAIVIAIVADKLEVIPKGLERRVDKLEIRRRTKTILTPALLSGGARGVVVIAVGMNTTIRVQILDETDCISHSTNTLGKGMNPIILPPAMGK